MSDMAELLKLPLPAGPVDAPARYLPASKPERQGRSKPQRTGSPPPCGEGSGVGVVRGRAAADRIDPPPHPSPTRGEGGDCGPRPTSLAWTAELVGVRLVEAMRILDRLRMPRGPRELGNKWPPIVRVHVTAARRTMSVKEWENALQDAQSSEELRDVSQWAFGRTRIAPSAAEITRMEQALAWPLRFLQRHEGAARVLAAWMVAKARGRADGRDDLKSICRKRGWAVSTARKKRARALALIAQGLAQAGEAVG